MRKIEFDKRLKGLNKVYLPLLEMARTIKVSKEKAEKERAREADDKRLAVMKNLRKANQKRAQRIKNRKEKQLKIVREERIEKQRKIQRGIQALKEIQKYQKGGRFVNPKVTFLKTG